MMRTRVWRQLAQEQARERQAGDSVVRIALVVGRYRDNFLKNQMFMLNSTHKITSPVGAGNTMRGSRHNAVHEEYCVMPKEHSSTPNPKTAAQRAASNARARARRLLNLEATRAKERAKRKRLRDANLDKNRAYQRAYRQNNLRKMRAQSRASYQRHQAKRRAANRQYRAEHLDAIRAQQRTSYAQNREQRNAKSRTYQHIHARAIQEQRRHYRQLHQAEIAQKHQQYHSDHKDELRDKQLRYYAENREQLLSRRRQKYANNPEHFAQQMRRWNQENPTKRQAIRQRRRACLRQSPVNDLTAAQWETIKAHYGHRCVYCQRKMKRLTQDHIIPLSKGGAHTASNIVPACGACNSRKKDRAPLCPVQPLLFA